MKKIVKKVSIILLIIGLILLTYDKVTSNKIEKINSDKAKIFLKKDQKIKMTKQKNNIKINNVIAVLEIPKIGLKQVLINPNSKHNNIGENITILKPVQMPDDKNSTFILAAHSGNSNVSYFNKINKLKQKDKVYVYYKNQKYEYQIYKYYEEKKDGSITIEEENFKRIILTTCKPFSNKQLVYIGKQKELYNKT